jgi:hypothetical protein
MDIRTNRPGRHTWERTLKVMYPDGVPDPPPEPPYLRPSLDLIRAGDAHAAGPAVWTDWKRRMPRLHGSLPPFPWD